MTVFCSKAQKPPVLAVVARHRDVYDTVNFESVSHKEVVQAEILVYPRYFIQVDRPPIRRVRTHKRDGPLAEKKQRAWSNNLSTVYVVSDVLNP